MAENDLLVPRTIRIAIQVLIHSFAHWRSIRKPFIDDVSLSSSESEMILWELITFLSGVAFIVIIVTRQKFIWRQHIAIAPLEQKAQQLLEKRTFLRSCTHTAVHAI